MAVSPLRTPRSYLLTQEQINEEALNQARLARPQGYGPLDSVAQGWASAGEGFNAGDLNQQALEQEQLGNEPAFSRLRRQAGRAQERASVLAPRVQSYEDVNGVGDAFSYLGGGVGAGARSMLPMVAAAAPGALVGGPVGALISGAGAFGAGYGMNRGENVTNQYADPDVMLRSADERAGAASMTALGQSALDAFVPGRIAHGLRGVGKMVAGTRAGNVIGDMLIEGATEGAQNELGRQGRVALGSQEQFDGSEVLNDAILGAVGAGPISAAGNVAGSVADRAVDAGLAGAGLVRDAAGKVKETVQEKVVPAAQRTQKKVQKSDVWKEVAASAQAAYDGAKTMGNAAMESPIFGEALQTGREALKSAASYVTAPKITETAERAADFLENTTKDDVKAYASNVFADRFHDLVGKAGVDETQDPDVLSGKVPNTPEGLNLRKVKLNDIYTAAAMSVLDGSGGMEYTDADRARAQALTESRTFTPSDELWLANSVGRPLLAKQLGAMKDSAVAYVADKLTSRPPASRMNRQGSALEARPLISAVSTLFGRDAAQAPDYATHLLDVSRDMASFDPHYVSKLTTKLAVADPQGTILQALRASGGNELADTMERELSLGAQGEVMRGEAPMLTQSAKDGDKLERAELLGIAGYIDRNAQGFARASADNKLKMLTPLIPIYGAETAQRLLTHYADVKRGELQAEQGAAQQGAVGVRDTLSNMFDPETAQGLIDDYQQYSGGQPGQLQNAFADRLGNLEQADEVVAMFKSLKNDKTLTRGLDDRPFSKGPADPAIARMGDYDATYEDYGDEDAIDTGDEGDLNQQTEGALSRRGFSVVDAANTTANYRRPQTVTPFYDGNDRDMEFLAEDLANASSPDARVVTMDEFADAQGYGKEEIDGYKGYLYKRVRNDIRRRLRESKKLDRSGVEALLEELENLENEGYPLTAGQQKEMGELQAKLKDPNLKNDPDNSVRLLTEQMQLLNAAGPVALKRFKVLMRPKEDLVASDEQIEKYSEVLKKATQDTQDIADSTKIVFRTKRGTGGPMGSNRLVLSAESMLYASPGKGSDAQRLSEAIAGVLARDDVIGMDEPAFDMVVRRGKGDKPAKTWAELGPKINDEFRAKYVASTAALEEQARKNALYRKQYKDARLDDATEALKGDDGVDQRYIDAQAAVDEAKKNVAKIFAQKKSQSLSYETYKRMSNDADKALKEAYKELGHVAAEKRVLYEIIERELDSYEEMPDREAFAAAEAEEAGLDGRYADEDDTAMAFMAAEEQTLRARQELVAGTSYEEIIIKQLNKIPGRREDILSEENTYEADTGAKVGAERLDSSRVREANKRPESSESAELRAWAFDMLDETLNATPERQQEILRRVNGFVRKKRGDIERMRSRENLTDAQEAQLLIDEDNLSYGAMVSGRLAALYNGDVPAPVSKREIAAFTNIEPHGDVVRPTPKVDTPIEKAPLTPAENRLRMISMDDLQARIKEYEGIPKRKLRAADRAEITVLEAEQARRKQEGMARMADMGKRSVAATDEAESTVPSGLFTMSDAQLEKRINEYNEKDSVGLYALIDERARRTVSMKRAANLPSGQEARGSKGAPPIELPKIPEGEEFISMPRRELTQRPYVMRADTGMSTFYREGNVPENSPRVRNLIEKEQKRRDKAKGRALPPSKVFPSRKALNSQTTRSAKLDELVAQDRAVLRNGVYYLKNAEDSKYAGGTTQAGAVFVNIGKLKAEGALTAYISDSPQKQEVFRQLGVDPAKLDATLGSAKRRAAFVREHELSHIRNGDRDAYPKTADGKLDLMHPKAIAIEVRATRDAIESIAPGVPREPRESRAAKKPSADKDEENTRSNRQAAEINRMLHGDDPTKIAVAHNSPHKVGGKFEWEQHRGKGEGSAAFSEGHYVSTSDATDRHYKRLFSKDGEYKYQKKVEQLEADLVTLDHNIAFTQKFLDAAQQGKTVYGLRRQGGRIDVSDLALDREQAEINQDYASGGFYHSDKPDMVLYDGPVSLGGLVEKLAEIVAGYNRDTAETRAKLEELNAGATAFEQGKSPTYALTLDAQPDELLHWHKPLSEQNPGVLERLNKSNLIPKGSGGLRYDRVRYVVDNPNYHIYGERRFIGFLDLASATQYAKTTFMGNGTNPDVEKFHAPWHPEKDVDLGADTRTGESIYNELKRHFDFDGVKASQYLRDELGFVAMEHYAQGGSQQNFPNYAVWNTDRLTQNYVEFSKQGAVGAKNTKAQIKAAKDEVARILGPKVMVQVNKMIAQLGGSGEWSTSGKQEIIKLAIDAANLIGVARHEALHGFFLRLGNKPDAVKLKQDLTDVASNPRVLAQLTKLLSADPNDKDALKQIQEGQPHYLEERLAYMYQFWSEGLLDITPKGRNMFQKIRDFFRNIVGVLSKEAKAERILTLLHSGEFADPTMVMTKIAENNIETANDKLTRIAPGFAKAMDKVFTAGIDRLRESGSPPVAALADTFEKFLQDRSQAGALWQNRLNKILEGKTKTELTAAMENFQAMRDPRPGLETEIAQFLSDMHAYQVGKNVKRGEFNKSTNQLDWVPLGKIEKNYFPRSFDGSAIESNRAEWDALLAKYVKDPIDRAAITDNFVKGDGREDVAENEHRLGYTPWSKAVARRKLRFITEKNAAEFAKFENKDFVDTLSTYVQQAVHRAEYADVFGNAGEVIQTAFEKAKLSPERQLELTKVTRGLEGTLGWDMNKSTKELFSGVMTMQNAVLLPLAIFSQMVDPLMISARSGKLGDAGRAYVQALKALTRKKGDDQKLAEWLGIVNDETVLQAMGNTYGSMYMSQRMRKFNKGFFKWNGMQGWNSAMRTAATVAGEKYLIENKDNAEALQELGLKIGDVKIDASGKRLDISKPDSKLGKALFQFVDESVIRPSAAHRATWMSDPRFMLLAHLKQFTFSMHKVVLERVAAQAEKGNYHPMKMLALATPVMLAADMAKWALTGSTPDSWTYLDYLSHAVQRSGVLGKYQFGADALGDAERGQIPGASFLGPAAEHLMVLMRYLTGGVGADEVIDRTIPGARYVIGG